MPACLSEDDPRNPKNQPPYQKLGDVKLPLTECLKDTVARVAPYFESVIKPEIQNGEKVLIAAHGNSIRALRKHLEGISSDEIAGMNIPTGIPLVYHLNEDSRCMMFLVLAIRKLFRRKLRQSRISLPSLNKDVI